MLLIRKEKESAQGVKEAWKEGALRGGLVWIE